MTLTVERDNAPIVSDAALQHWGRVYLANPWLRSRGILFETFLRHPNEILGAGLNAVLPAQLAVRQRVDVLTQRSALLERHTESMLASRRIHVTDGRTVETVHGRGPQRRAPADHKPWRLEAAR